MPDSDSDASDKTMEFGEQPAKRCSGMPFVSPAAGPRAAAATTEAMNGTMTEQSKEELEALLLRPKIDFSGVFA